MNDVLQLQRNLIAYRAIRDETEIRHEDYPFIEQPTVAQSSRFL